MLTKLQIQVIAVVILLGIMSTYLSVSMSINSVKHRMYVDSVWVAQEIGDTSKLTGTEFDASNPEYFRIKEILEKAKADNWYYDYIFLLGVNKKKEIVFYGCTDTDTADVNTYPGTIYQDVSASIKESVENKISLTTGVLKDSCGKFIAAIAPVGIESNEVVGVSMPAYLFYTFIILCAIPTLFLTFAIIVFVISNRHCEDCSVS